MVVFPLVELLRWWGTAAVLWLEARKEGRAGSLSGRNWILGLGIEV